MCICARTHTYTQHREMVATLSYSKLLHEARVRHHVTTQSRGLGWQMAASLLTYLPQRSPWCQSLQCHQQKGQRGQNHNNGRMCFQTTVCCISTTRTLEHTNQETLPKQLARVNGYLPKIHHLDHQTWNCIFFFSFILSVGQRREDFLGSDKGFVCDK